MIFTVRALTFNCHSGFETGCSDRTVNQRKEVEQQQQRCVRLYVCYTGKRPMHARHHYKCCMLHTTKKPLEMIFTKPHVMRRNKATKKKTSRCFSLYERVRNVLSEISSSWYWALFCPAIFRSVDRTLLACKQLSIFGVQRIEYISFIRKSWADEQKKSHFNFGIFQIVQINICIRCCVWFSLCCYRVIVSGVNAPKGNISYLHLVDFATLRCWQ